MGANNNWVLVYRFIFYYYFRTYSDDWRKCRNGLEDEGEGEEAGEGAAVPRRRRRRRPIARRQADIICPEGFFVSSAQSCRYWSPGRKEPFPLFSLPHCCRSHGAQFIEFLTGSWWLLLTHSAYGAGPFFGLALLFSPCTAAVRSTISFCFGPAAITTIAPHRLPCVTVPCPNQPTIQPMDFPDSDDRRNERSIDR